MVGGKGNFMGRKKEDCEHYANSTTRQKKPFRIEKVTTVFLIGRFQFVNLITTFEQHSALIHYTECQRFFLNGFWCQACLYCANNAKHFCKLHARKTWYTGYWPAGLHNKYNEHLALVDVLEPQNELTSWFLLSSYLCYLLICVSPCPYKRHDFILRCICPGKILLILKEFFFCKHFGYVGG